MNHKIIVLLMGAAILLVGCDQTMTTDPVADELPTGLVKAAPARGDGVISFKEASDYDNEGYVVVGYLGYSIVEGPNLTRNRVDVALKADLQILPDDQKKENLYVAKGSVYQVNLGPKQVGYFDVMYPVKEGEFAVWISFKVTSTEVSVENVRVDDIKG